MSSPLLVYLPLLIGVLIAIGLTLVILLLNSLLGPRRSSTVKGEPFEFGNPPVGPARNRFNVKFYLVALVFLAFDVQVVFMLPWAVQYRALIRDPEIGVLALAEMLIFVTVSLVGLIYVWKRGVLDWNRPEAEEEQL